MPFNSGAEAQRARVSTADPVLVLRVLFRGITSKDPAHVVTNQPSRRLHMNTSNIMFRSTGILATVLSRMAPINRHKILTIGGPTTSVALVHTAQCS